MKSSPQFNELGSARRKAGFLFDPAQICAPFSCELLVIGSSCSSPKRNPEFNGFEETRKPVRHAPCGLFPYTLRQRKTGIVHGSSGRNRSPERGKGFVERTGNRRRCRHRLFV